MKKISIVFFTLCIYLAKLNAQEFAKGDFLIGLNAGFGQYKLITHTEYNQLSTITNKIERIIFDSTDIARSYSIPLTAEYGLADWMGIGFRLGYNNFLPAKDSLYKTVPKTRSFDAGIMASFHFIKAESFEIPIQLHVGYSNYGYKSKNSTGFGLKGNGVSFGIALNPTYYFNETVGIYINAGFYRYSFSNVTMYDNNDTNINNNNNRDYVMGLTGYGFQAGVGCKIRISTQKSFH